HADDARPAQTIREQLDVKARRHLRYHVRRPWDDPRGIGRRGRRARLRQILWPDQAHGAGLVRLPVSEGVLALTHGGLRVSRTAYRAEQQRARNHHLKPTPRHLATPVGCSIDPFDRPMILAVGNQMFARSRSILLWPAVNALPDLGQRAEHAAGGLVDLLDIAAAGK